jgi:branched-chain amino acid transport system substrate-binding protein
MKKTMFRSAVVGISLMACGLAPALAEELTIGALLPLTGPAAPVGTEQQKGVQFAIDQFNAAGGLNGDAVQIAFDDSQGKPDQGVLAFNRLADLQKTPVMLTAFSSISLAIAPLATRREILVMNPAAQSNKLESASPYLFNTIPLVGAEAQVIAEFTLDKVGKRAAIIYENGAAGIDSRDDFAAHFKEVGGEIVADEPVEFGQTNYRAALLKVADSKPDVVFIAITQSHEALIDQIAQIPDFPVAVGTTFLTFFFGFETTDGWYQTAIRSSDPEPKALEAFKAKYGTEDMPYFAREYYNTTNIILQTAQMLVDQGKDLTGPNLKKAIEEIGTFESSIASITFDGNNARRAITVQQFAGDERKTVDSREAQSSK